MPASPAARSGAVTAAAVVAILGSILLLLCAVFGLLGVVMMQNMPGNPAAEQPPELRYAGFVGVAFIAAAAVWGLASGIGLLRYRNWARISTLVWSGITVPVGTLALLFSLTMKFPVPPGAPQGADAAVRGFLVIFYALPIAIGIWWLILFTRKRTVAMFTSSSTSVGAGVLLDASGFPATPLRRHVPLPISVVGWFLIVSGVLAPLFYFLQPPAFILFGHILRGSGAAFVMFVSWISCLAGGIGLLKLKPWSFWLVLFSQGFWMLSGTISLLNPDYDTLMKQLMASNRFARNPESPVFSNFHAFGVLILLCLTIPLVTILYYRARFLPSSADRVSRPG
jgi:hypothetical protein